MSDVDKLLEIEEHYKSIEECRKNLYQLDHDQNLKLLREKYDSTEMKIEDLDLSINKAKISLRKLEQEFQMHNEKLNNYEKTLYDGSVTDLKQLEHLEKEKQYHKAMIDENENRMLDIIESIEGMENEIEMMSDHLRIIGDRIVDRKDKVEELLVQYNNKFKEEEEKLFYVSNEVDPDLLDQYKEIRARKGSGMAELRNKVCSGCNMMISENFVEKAKLGTNIVLCENCGRILYVSKND